jgi:DNA-binding transcriptional regulator PaaX
MVHNPKFSQEGMTWCIESALGLIFKAVKYANRKKSWNTVNDLLAKECDDRVSRQQISKMVYSLKKNGYIDLTGSDSVKLTNKAKMRIIDQIADSQNKECKYHLVSFDIPELMRENRNHFRSSIKRMGFKQIQESLWVLDRNVGEYVDMSAKECGVSEYVAYFVAEASNVDDHISTVLSVKTKDKLTNQA